MPTQQEKIQADNLLEEISEILEPCMSCGLCKSFCPVFKIIREEPHSPRGKNLFLKEKLLDKIVFECNLCKSCESNCPLDIKICTAIRKAREALVLKGKELKQNKEMIQNIRKTGNPFGDMKNLDKDKLYCC